MKQASPRAQTNSLALQFDRSFGARSPREARALVQNLMTASAFDALVLEGPDQAARADADANNDADEAESTVLDVTLGFADIGGVARGDTWEQGKPQ